MANEDRSIKAGSTDLPRDPVAENERAKTTTDSAGQTEGTHKAFDARNAPEPGPDRPISDEERAGTSPVDLNPEPALGVGTSRGGRAEDQAPDRDDVERDDDTGRARGEADPEGSGI